MHLKLPLALLLLFAVFTAKSQDSSIDLVSSSADYGLTDLQYSLATYSLENVNGGQVLRAAGASPILKKGAPDLPRFSTSIIIPDARAMKVELIDSSYTELQNIDIAPSLGNIYRNLDPSQLARVPSSTYSTNDWYPGNVVELANPYVLRDFRGQTVYIQPFQYNPLTRVLRVYHHLDVRVSTQEGDAIVNPLVRSHEARIHPAQAATYTSHFLNYSNQRYTPIETAERMLIIAYPDFLPALTPFINWKTRTGMQIEVKSVAEFASADAIKTYISNAYNQNDLSYVILVGDIDQVPSLTAAGGKSDPSYGFITGEDAYPEVLIGRLSAETLVEVETQVQKIINYDQAIGFADSGEHLSRMLGIGSDQGPGDDGEMDFEHIRNMREKLLDFTYTQADGLYDGNQGAEDTPGNPEPPQVAQVIDNGIGLLLYTGHGSCTSLGTSGFSNVDVDGLDNAGKLPFIWSVACVNGEFDNGTCFGEAWLRATRNGQGTGAVGAFMSSINQSWNPPMAAQDEMVDILVGNYPDLWARTFGSVSLNGCMQMNDEYGDAGAEMTSTWHMFGDPSMLLRTMPAQDLSVNHTVFLPVGTTQIQVESEVEHALVGITQDGVLLGSGRINSGVALIEIAALASVSPLEVVVTAFNYRPYMGFIQVESPENAFVLVDHHTISDPFGNLNQMADYNEEVYLVLDVQNVGIQASGNVQAVLTSSTPGITILNDACSLGMIDGESHVSTQSCFSIQIADGLLDQSPASFNVTFSDDAGNIWEYPITLLIQAPKLEVTSWEVEELSGNNNGRLDAGETGRLSFHVLNDGHSASVLGNAVITNLPAQVTLINSSVELSLLGVQSSTTLVFDFMVSSSVAQGTIINFPMLGTAGAYQVNALAPVKVGAVIEDAESGDFTAFNWQNVDGNPWQIDSEIKYTGDYSFRSGDISEDQSSTLEINLEAQYQDSIRFYCRVSSEQEYDFLNFYIDDVLMAAYSGELNWTYQAFVVPAGLHNYRWEYIKDYVVSSGLDAAWVDNIEFPAGSSATGIDQGENSLPAWNIFPNPAISQVSIQSEDARGSMKVSLLNALGQELLVSQVTFEDGQSTFTLPANIAAGLYFLKLGEHVKPILVNSNK